MLRASGSVPACFARHLGSCFTTTASRSGFWHQHQSEQATNDVEVCFVDPKQVLDLQNDAAAAQHVAPVSLHISNCLLSELSKGLNELGDTDDPMNNWYFGKAAEVFQYNLVGTHSTTSGFTSIISKHILDELLAGRSTCKMPTWDEFTKMVDGNRVTWPCEKLPFLFAGRVVDSDTAAVYELREGVHVAGLMVSSEAFT